MKNQNKATAGHLCALFAICIWGLTFIASKTLLTAFSPLQVMMLRFIIAYVVLVLLDHRYSRPVWKEEGLFLLLALFGSTLYFICENVALTMTLTSNVSIIVALAPIFTAVLAHFFAGERMNGNTVFGFLIAFAGVVLVVFNGTFILKLNPLGDALAFGAALLWAIYTILLKRCVSQFSNLLIARKMIFYSILSTLPLLLIEGRSWNITELFTMPRIVSLLWLGILGSGLCYVVWNYSTQQLGAVRTNNYIYLIPFVTMLGARLFLKEQVTLMGMLGALLIVAGVLAANHKANHKNKNVY